MTYVLKYQKNILFFCAVIAHQHNTLLCYMHLMVMTEDHSDASWVGEMCVKPTNHSTGNEEGDEQVLTVIMQGHCYHLASNLPLQLE